MRLITSFPDIKIKITMGGRIDSIHKKFIRMFNTDIGIIPAGK